ncbi:hypothetical protein CTI12_AA227360 [Artemisia annua]|nr:hypothetical protein CTI12_AA227360 [Artemisia annua]
MEFMHFASGDGVKKVTLITKDVVYKVSVRGLNSSYCLIFGKSWDLYKGSKGVIDGWNIHFRSVCNKYLRVTGYNLEGMTTDLDDNFRGRAHSCVSVASSCSKSVQIFAKGFFKHLNSRVRRPISVVTCHGRYHVDGHVIGGKVYGFDGEAWELLFLKENILEGQKMVLCYLGDYKYRLTVFDHNGVEVHPFKDVFEDDRYDRVVDAAARQMVLVED